MATNEGTAKKHPQPSKFSLKTVSPRPEFYTEIRELLAVRRVTPDSQARFNYKAKLFLYFIW
jgi:hypothetical protein